jgi:hypothetical protein
MFLLPALQLRLSKPTFLFFACVNFVSLSQPSFPLDNLHIHSLNFIMELTYIYAIAAGGIFIILFLLTLRLHFMRFIDYLVLWQCKYLTYPQILRRHSLLGP